MAGDTTGRSARAVAAELEQLARPPAGSGERFSGYAVMGLPFSSGHVLALRRFPASSIGPGYTSMWVRSPGGDWTMYTSVDPALSCSRYFGRAFAAASVRRIRIDWPDDDRLTVSIADGVDLDWDIRLGSTPVTRLMSALAGLVPDGLWRSRRFLRALGAAAGPSLQAGRLALTGLTPNDQLFGARLVRLWSIRDSTASLGGKDLGTAAPLPDQARLGGLWIPQRGFFLAGSVAFAPAGP